MDPRLLSEAGGDILLAKIPSPHKIVQLTFQPGMFTGIKEGSLLVADTSSWRTSGTRPWEPHKTAPSVDVGSYFWWEQKSWTPATCWPRWTCPSGASGRRLPWLSSHGPVGLQGWTMASSPPPPFCTSRIGLVKASGGCPSYWGSRSGYSVCTRAGE